MKKIILLLALLFIGVVSFANTIPANSSSQHLSTALAVMLNSTVDNSIAIARLNANQEKDAFRIESVNVKYMATSCTVTITASIGYNETHVTVTESATAETCDEAWDMALKKLGQRLHQIRNAL